MKIITSYRLAPVDRQTGLRGVEKIVTKRDGTHEYIAQGKIICPTLGEFREAYPGVAVEGAPQAEELALQLGTLSDEKLAELGFTRTAEADDSIFASPHARTLAKELGMDADLLLETGGPTGATGLFTTADIRRIYEDLNG